MKKNLFTLLLLVGLIIPQVGHASQFGTWRDITDEMNVILESAYDTYFTTKDADQGKALVNKAYFDFYEKLGVERAVMSYVSGKRASTVEYQFAAVKRLMDAGAPNKEVRASIDELQKMLREDGNSLDGREESGLSIFLASLLILVREGFEAILVVAAIAAYVTRSGNGRLTRVVYTSALAAVALSAVLAFALQQLFSLSGANQEILEGATMLLAVVVLVFVSNWMAGKAKAEVWNDYIKGKVDSAVTTGGSFALGLAAFLAVFREGAETILFYQALMGEAKEHMDMFWLGMAAAVLCLVVIFIIIRYGSLKLPIRPFFIGTSVLMYIMAIAFAGGGIKELQEGDVISVTPVSFIGTVDILGIYPTMETLAPQILLVALAVLACFYYSRRPAAKQRVA